MRTMQTLAALLVLLIMPLTSQAKSVEAEGRALIYQRDLISARQQALHQASQQAQLQVGAQVTSMQQIDQGILTVDHLKVRSSGELDNIRILSEQIQGDYLVLRIRADVVATDTCLSNNLANTKLANTKAASTTTRYLKSVAVAGFSLVNRQQASLGGLFDIEQALPAALVTAINTQGTLRALNASHLGLPLPPKTTRGSYQRPSGALSESLERFSDLDVQFIISGTISDLGMLTRAAGDEGNYLRSLYDRYDSQGRQHLRQFAVDIGVYDGLTGALLFNRSYQLAGLWNLAETQRTGFASAAFTQTDYGQRIAALITQLGIDLDQQLRCEPFRARIIRTDANAITFNAGSVTGIRPGDQFQVLRRATFYDPDNHPHTELEPTNESLVVNEVHPQFSRGRIGVNTRQLNIQRDDIIMAW